MFKRTRIGPQDSLWLDAERQGRPMTIDAVIWTATPVDRDRAISIATTRMWWRYPVLRCRPVRDGDGSWWWMDDPGCTMSDLVIDKELDSPDDPHSLQRLIAGHRHDHLPRHRPLWQVMFVQNYRGGSALILRVHHAVADGLGLVQLAGALLEADDDGTPLLVPDVEPLPTAPPPEVVPRPTLRSGLVDGIQRAAVNPVGVTHGVVRQFMDMTRCSAAALLSDLDAARKLLAGTRNDPASWTAQRSNDEFVAWSSPLQIGDVREVAHRYGATINDVGATCVALALQQYLHRRKERCTSVSFMVPVANRVPDLSAQELGNKFALVQLELPTDQPDPVAVIQTIRRRTQRIKAGHEALVDLAVQHVVAEVGQRPQRFATALLAGRAIGVLTDVPGPPMQVWIAGARVAGIVGWAPVLGDQPFSFTMCSYDSELIIGMACDRQLVSGSEQIVTSLVDAFEALRAA